ncbi:thioredoxin family protein [uncultured Jannaschia sp.]|uniref:DUF1223 domain-containing protein n=1 Tax=uncultured Jannaschia sp. TaxID=293347 RepID=UPI002604161E|nr:DUF1223 domain-containing protein [uncultured Jannaschia sp.]
MRLAPLAFAALAALPAAADPVVIELYTSQGCSSCPPADEMLGQLAENDEVIALSFHVDYWDWIGWKDTFADPAHTARQRAYAAAEGANTVYTPQFIVGGTDGIAGADGMTLAGTIRAHEGSTGDVLRMASTGEGRKVMAAETALTGPARLVLLTVLPEAEVRILHGENAGKDVTYHSIVRAIDDLGTWDGAETSVPIPDAPDGMRQVVVAQALDGAYPGAIIGAVRAD